MGKFLQRLSRYRWRRVALALLSAPIVGGCTLPSQQLALPGPVVDSPNTPAIATNNHRPGVDLSNPASPGLANPQIYQGSGVFTGSIDKSGPSAAGGSKASVDGDGNITLNLAGASINELAQAVLGDVLKLNYVVSDKIKSTVTLSTSQPVNKQQLLHMFEAVLQAEKLVMSNDNGVYVIAPADGAGTPAQLSAKAGTNGIGSATQVYTLRYISASEMERLASSIAPQARIVRADKDRNTLVVSGTQLELASIADAVDVFDVDWMKGMSVGIFPIESGDPEAVAKELDTIFANDRESPIKGMVRFVPNKRLKSIVVISSRPEYLTKAQKWVDRIDKAGQATEKQVHVYHVQNRPAAELAELLQKVYAVQSSRGSEAPAPTAPAQATTELSATNDPILEGNRGGVFQVQPGVPVLPGQSANAAQPARPAANVTQLDEAANTAALETASIASPTETGDDRTSGISVIADVPNNSLVITATSNEYRRVRRILSRIDLAPNQVLLEGTIAEVKLNDQLQYGLKWFFEHKNNQFTFTDSVIGAVAPSFPGFSYFLNTPNVKVALDALSTITDVNIVSSPSLTVLDNKRAVLQIGDEVPIATQSAVSVTAPGAPVVNSISFRNTGVILGITPRISDDGRVLLDIEQEVSDVVRTTTSDLDSPTIQQRRINTTVAVRDGETIVLAGLMQDTTTISRDQVPMLGDIPVVGNLFKSKNNEIARTELLIALTPHIVKDQHQMRAISAEFRDRMNFNTRPQRAGPPDRRENFDRLIVR